MAPDSAAPEGPKPVHWRKRFFFRLLRFYPPYLGAGVWVAHIAPDLSLLEVRMKLRWWNRNYLGTHFGGSLYAMCDPFFVLVLIQQLGRGYIVWDKAATIRFRRPGHGTMKARFAIPPEEVERIRGLADSNRKVEPVFYTEVLDGEGKVVAEVEKVLYVRRKDKDRA